MGKKYNAIVVNFGPDAPYNENHFIINETLFQKLVQYLEAEDQQLLSICYNKKIFKKIFNLLLTYNFKPL